MFSPCVKVPFTCNKNSPRDWTDEILFLNYPKSVSSFQLRDRVVVVLLNEAFRLVKELVESCIGPPRYLVPILVRFVTMMIEAVRDFVTNHSPNGSVVQCPTIFEL